MKILSVKGFPLNLHHLSEHQTSFTKYKAITNILVRITADDGTVGIGEGALIPQHLGEDQTTALSLVNDRFAPLLAGVDPYDLNFIHRAMRRVAAEGRGAKSAIDMALHDLIARKQGIPLYRLLGGIVQEKFSTASGIGFADPDSMLGEIREKMARGFRSFEVKMSGVAEADLQRCQILARNVPPEVVLILDPNEGWSVTETISIGRRLDRFENRLYFEQPVPKENLSGMAQARRGMGIPIIAHEPITSAAHAYEVIRSDAADVINVTIARLGSIGACLDVMGMSKAAGLDYRIDAPIQSKIGDTAVAHLGVASEHILAACDTHLFVEGGPAITGGLAVADGWVTVPDKPGIGVEVGPLGEGSDKKGDAASDRA